MRGDGQVLLAQRPPGKAYAGYWEFPGGKLEAGETPAAALARELHEELGITVRRASPWLVQEFVYPHAHVELHFFRVFEWEGELVGHDGQAFAWQTPGRYTLAPLLPANTRILAALELPPVYGITHAEAMGEAAFLARAERAFAAGLRLVQLRDKTLPMPRRRALAAALLPLARRFGARVLWNGTAEEARAAACDGVHWTAATLAAAHERPRDLLVAASCHTRGGSRPGRRARTRLRRTGPGGCPRRRIRSASPLGLGRLPPMHRRHARCRSMRWAACAARTCATPSTRARTASR